MRLLTESYLKIKKYIACMPLICKVLFFLKVGMSNHLLDDIRGYISSLTKIKDSFLWKFLF